MPIVSAVVQAQLDAASDLGASAYYAHCDGRGNAPAVDVAEIVARYSDYDPAFGDARPDALASAFVAGYQAAAAENQH